MTVTRRWTISRAGTFAGLAILVAVLAFIFAVRNLAAQQKPGASAKSADSNGIEPGLFARGMAADAPLDHFQAVDAWLDMSGDPSKAVVLACLRVVEIRRAQGRAAEALPFLRTTLANLNSPSARFSIQQILAEVLIETGQIDEGVKEYEALVGFAKTML